MFIPSSPQPEGTQGEYPRSTVVKQSLQEQATRPLGPTRTLPIGVVIGVNDIVREVAIEKSASVRDVIEWVLY